MYLKKPTVKQPVTFVQGNNTLFLATLQVCANGFKLYTIKVFSNNGVRYYKATNNLSSYASIGAIGNYTFTAHKAWFGFNYAAHLQ